MGWGFRIRDDYMWKTKSSDGIPKKKKFVKRRQTCRVGARGLRSCNREWRVRVGTREAVMGGEGVLRKRSLRMHRQRVMRVCVEEEMGGETFNPQP